jgi:hypothetical protein
MMPQMLGRRGDGRRLVRFWQSPAEESVRDEPRERLSAKLAGAFAQEVISSGRMSSFLDECNQIIIFPKGLF